MKTEFRVVWNYTDGGHFPAGSPGWEDSNSDHHPYTETQARERAAEMVQHSDYLKVENVRVQARTISDWSDSK